MMFVVAICDVCCVCWDLVLLVHVFEMCIPAGTSELLLVCTFCCRHGSLCCWCVILGAFFLLFKFCNRID